MYGRGPRPVDMAQLRIAPAHVQAPPVLQLEPHCAVLHPDDLGGLAVDKAQPSIVSGPANAVALTQLHRISAVDLNTAGPAPELVRQPGNDFTVLSGEVNSVAGHPGDA